MSVRLIINVLWKRRQLHRHDWWTRQQLEAHQTRALHLLRAYAYARSPFYQRFHKGCVDHPLHELPVLTKRLLMEHFDELITDRQVCLRDVEAFLASLCGNERFRDRYWVNATSGSTGRRGLFLFDAAEWTTVLASYARVYEWGGVLPSLTHRRKMAVVSTTTPWHQSAQVGATVHSWWTPTVRLDAASPTEEIVKRLNVWQPETLVAYASTADLLAKEQLTGRLRIAPRAVFTASEVLTRPMRERMTQAWGQQPLNVYAATESAAIAAECHLHRGLHLFEDLVITEVVDEDNRPVPPGTPGEKVLVTVLFSRTQPLIRYEMSDQVQVATSPCACGRPYACLETIQGRVEDVLLFPAVTGERVTVHPNVFHEVLDLLPVSGWQIVQRTHGLSVLVSGMPDDISDTVLIDAVRCTLAKQGAIAPPVSIERIAAVPRGAVGKAALIRSELPQGEVTTCKTDQ